MKRTLSWLIAAGSVTSTEGTMLLLAQRRFGKVVVGRLSGAGKLLCLALLVLGVLGSSSAYGQTSGFVYTANLGNVSAFAINGVTGQLVPVVGSPFPAGEPQAVAVDATGRFVYVVNLIGGNVSGYTIAGGTGALTAIPGSPFLSGLDPLSVTVDPKGRFVYVANCEGFCEGFGGPDTGSVSGFAINDSTGALTEVPGSPFPARTPFSVTVDPTGSFVYVANCGYPCGALPGDIDAYRIDGVTGQLSLVPGSPFPVGVAPYAIVVSPTGKFVYVANQAVNTISAYSIDSGTGALTVVPDSPFAVGAGQPQSLAVNPTSQYLYTANFLGGVSAFSIDAATGGLTALPNSPFPSGRGPSAITVDPTGKFAFVADYGDNGVFAHTIDSVTGSLSPVAGSPFPAGLNPGGIASTLGPLAPRAAPVP